jgi:hypothetical protein
MDLFTYLPPSTQQPSLNQWTKRKRRPLWRTHMFVEIILLGRSTLLDLRSTVWRMPAGEQLRDLYAMMRILLWKMLFILMLEHFCIPIGSKKCVTQIVKLTTANENSYRKSVEIRNRFTIFYMANFMLPFHTPKHQQTSKFSCQTLCMTGLALCTMLCMKKPSFEAACIS